VDIYTEFMSNISKIEKKYKKSRKRKALICSIFSFILSLYAFSCFLDIKKGFLSGVNNFWVGIFFLISSLILLASYLKLRKELQPTYKV